MVSKYSFILYVTIIFVFFSDFFFILKYFKGHVVIKLKE